MNPSLSAYLDLLRVSSAIVVLVTHLAYTELSRGMLHPWRLVGNDAVMVFFVLSGYVIAHATDKKHLTATDYAVSRLARLWSVAAPALALTILFDQAGRYWNPAAYSAWWYQDTAPVWRTLTALTFTNELWFTSVRPFSNGPYWSLGYEFWYYALFGAATFLRRRARVVVIAVLCMVVGPKILLLLPVWWLGVWAYRRNVSRPVSLGTGVTLMVVSAMAYAVYRASVVPVVLRAITSLTFGPDGVTGYLKFSDEFLSSFIIGPLVAWHFIGAHAVLTRISVPAVVASVIAWFAKSTFTIYLLHYPILRFIAAVVPYNADSRWHVTAVGLGTLAICLVVGSVIEKRKDGLRRMLLQLVQLVGPARMLITARARPGL